MTPTLVLSFSLKEADRLRRYAGPTGGRQLLAGRLFAATKPTGENRYRATVTAFDDVLRLARSTEGSGGWQSLIRRMRPTLVVYTGRPLTTWDEIRAHLVSVEREHAAGQTVLPVFAAAFADDFRWGNR